MAAGVGLVRVVKMNGTRNEFVVLDERSPRFGEYGKLARRVCDRETGIGADGLLVLLPPSASGIATMRVFNADGGEAEMCGNGIRCVARYLWEEGCGNRFVLDTLGGPVGLEVVDHRSDVAVRVDLGVPQILQRYREGAAFEALGQTWRYGRVSVGNPHAVVFVDDPYAVDLERLGARVQSLPAFASGINLHLARALDIVTLAVRHYERGVGITQACGTGATAAAVLAIDDGRVRTPVQVQVPGGLLGVDWRPGGRATLWGDAEVEFERFLALEAS